MNNALKNLLNSLDRIASAHEEITDTDVRERLGACLEGILLNFKDYKIPDDFGMFEYAGNELVRQAIEEFKLEYSESGGISMQSIDQVRDYIQNENTASDKGNKFDEYFGWIDSMKIKKGNPPRAWWKIW